MIKLLSEFGPLVAFFIGFKVGGIHGATLYMLIASVIGISVCYIVERKIQLFTLISSGILIVSAIITLTSGDSFFIKFKPTVLYVVFACIFLISALQNRPVMKFLLHNTLPLKEQCWNILSYRFAAFFFIMAIVNEIVWRNFDDLFWVKFKVFGAIPLTLIFIILQIPFFIKNRLLLPNEDKT